MRLFSRTILGQRPKYFAIDFPIHWTDALWKRKKRGKKREKEKEGEKEGEIDKTDVQGYES